MISVVVITHNRNPETLGRAIESVINQEYRDIEIIVVNDSTSDYKLYGNVREMMTNLKRRNQNLRYIEHSTSQGACAARNTGLKNANGEFIAFLDDDDEWTKDKLSKQLKVFQESGDSKLALVYCGFCFVYDDKEYLEKRYNGEMFRGKVYEKLLGNNFIYGASFPLIRTEVMNELGGFDERFPSCQDWDVWLRIAEKWNVDYCSEPLVRYHVHSGEQITKSSKNRINGLEKLIDKHRKGYEHNEEAYKAILQRLVYQYATYGDMKKTFETLKVLTKSSPLSFAEKSIMYVKILKWKILKR